MHIPRTSPRRGTLDTALPRGPRKHSGMTKPRFGFLYVLPQRCHFGCTDARAKGALGEQQRLILVRLRSLPDWAQSNYVWSGVLDGCLGDRRFERFLGEREPGSRHPQPSNFDRRDVGQLRKCQTSRALAVIFSKVGFLIGHTPRIITGRRDPVNMPLDMAHAGGV